MKLQTQIIILLIGQFLTILALLITNFINRRYTSRVLKDKIQIEKNVEYMEKQLTEFYSPIYSLISMNKEITANTRYDIDAKELNKTVPNEVWNDIRENILIPNNNEILDILKKNIHLIEGEEIPESFFSFILHARVFPLMLKHEHYIEDYFNTNFKFPAEFSDNIIKTTKKLIKNYNTLIKK